MESEDNTYDMSETVASEIMQQIEASFTGVHSKLDLLVSKLDKISESLDHLVSNVVLMRPRKADSFTQTPVLAADPI
jgi:hypothetical protein